MAKTSLAYITPDIIEDACLKMAEGISLRAYARSVGISESTLRYHLAKDEDAFAQTARARELGCDALADECIEIADDPTLEPQDRRVRIETRLKLIGKWSQRYGDKIAVTNTSTVTHRYELDSLDADELDALERIAEKASNAAGDKGGASKAEPASVH